MPIISLDLLNTSHCFSPIAIEIIGAVVPKSIALLWNIGYGRGNRGAKCERLSRSVTPSGSAK